MAVKIRLARRGSKKRPFYRIVVADSRSPRDGRFLDIIGTYDPLQDPAKVEVNNAKLQEWIKNGATLTETVKAIIKKAGLKGKQEEAA
jgi:small subunit ribosomal protein S16